MLIARTMTHSVAWSVIALMLSAGFSVRSESQPRPLQPKAEYERTALPQYLEKLFIELTPSGWEISDKVKRFTADNLYRHINGGADLYISHNFSSMTFTSYSQKANPEQFVNLFVYDMGNPTNAFGVFSTERSKGQPSLNLGRSSYRADANYFIWHGQYYIRIISSDISEELQHIGLNLAQKVTDSLIDSGESVWGLTVLPKVDVVPGSIQYFSVNAMGLDFMSNTYIAQYSKDNKFVTVFLSQRDSVNSAQDTVIQYIEFAKEFGNGVERIHVDGEDFVLCKMDEGYDIVFQKDQLVGGVTSVESQAIAQSVATDLWRSLYSQ